ncbi:WxL domain-containing protein [Latilactobacillus fragifolii]|uniref:WxL domain-containing protein n=1 Tax=Latilactobacillus fragifolii TaxID=2814244 RepID=UPI001ABAA939|nr:WxL domain-containing protein [Latilactobacillus fragifolii]
MKFTKLTSATLASATVLSILAPTTSAFAATAEGKTADNGGVALPQTDTTKAGISFGDNKPNPNTGFLRLQMVPHVLDFGNHTKFDTAYTTFTADGKNYANPSNDRQASYENGKANQTALLNTQDPALIKANENGDAWATVVDKQVTRTPNKTYDAKTTQASGDWTLSVKANDSLKSASGQELADGQLLFKNMNYGHTQDVFGLTNETQDQSFKDDMANLAKQTPAVDPGTKDVSTLDKTIAVDMSSNDTQHEVAKAATGEGTGANVFGWAPEDIQLVLPAATSVQNAEYTANLTWTLNAVK